MEITEFYPHNVFTQILWNYVFSLLTFLQWIILQIDFTIFFSRFFFCTLCVSNMLPIFVIVQNVSYICRIFMICQFVLLSLYANRTRSVRTMMFLMTSLALMIFLGFLNVFCYVFYSTFNRIFVSKLRWNANGHFIQNK